jgi:hypothetical protein
MPSLLRHTDCPACGHRHHFCLLTDDLVLGREYAYVCPANGRKATLRPTSAAEIVHTPTQGAVALTLATYDSAPSPRQPEASHPQPVDPGSLPEEALARVSPPPPAASLSGPEREVYQIGQEVHEIGREVQGLAARVGELEEKVTTAPPVAPAPASPLPAGANEPEPSPTRLQEVLPEVKDLAGKVGGLEKLSDIVETLKEAKKE